VRLAPTVLGFANYSWQAQPRPTGFDIAELNLPPSHRFNVGFSATRRRYFGSVSASYVGGAYWQDVLPQYQGWTVAYTLLDGGVGVHSADDSMAVAIRGTNLLDHPIQQHIFGDVIRRCVIAEVRFQL
jgi:hypothetical protein